MPDIKDILKNEDFGSIVGGLCVDTPRNAGKGSRNQFHTRLALERNLFRKKFTK